VKVAKNYSTDGVPRHAELVSDKLVGPIVRLVEGEDFRVARCLENRHASTPLHVTSKKLGNDDGDRIARPVPLPAKVSLSSSDGAWLAARLANRRSKARRCAFRPQDFARDIRENIWRDHLVGCPSVWTVDFRGPCHLRAHSAVHATLPLHNLGFTEMKRDEEWTRAEMIGLAVGATALAVIAGAAGGLIVWWLL